MGLVAEGKDTYCLDSLQPGRWARGKTLVGQRLYHRLITPKGALRGGEDEADFGFDLSEYVGQTDPRTLDTALPVRVKNELLKDPAVDAVSVTATRTVAGGEVAWRLTVQAETTEGDVELIVAVSSVTVELLGVP